uniref:Uncharacterized protein n=1 Tax=Mycena chlorophos TaxID=658473 RepID=A0ABQ0M7F0_MYCCL|nr:predicted protein [Mycena chlorophos]
MSYMTWRDLLRVSAAPSTSSDQDSVALVPAEDARVTNVATPVAAAPTTAQSAPARTVVGRPASSTRQRPLAEPAAAVAHAASASQLRTQSLRAPTALPSLPAPNATENITKKRRGRPPRHANPAPTPAGST